MTKKVIKKVELKPEKLKSGKGYKKNPYGESMKRFKRELKKYMRLAKAGKGSLVVDEYVNARGNPVTIFTFKYN